MGNSAFIRFIRTGQVMPLEVVTATAENREHYLKPFAGSATVECLCAHPPIPMTVAHRRVGTESWYLCPASATEKHRHAEWCPLHLGAGNDSADNLDAPPAVTVEDNRTIIRGSFTRTWAEAKPGAKADAERSETGSSKASARSGLAVLLWALWSQAQLNTWKPVFLGKRFYGSIRGRLLSGAQRVTVESGRSNWSLADDLHIPPAWSAKDQVQKTACAQFEAMLHAKLSHHQVLFLAGQFRKIDETDADGGRMIYLSHFRHGLWLPPGLAQRLEKATSQWAGGLAGEEGEHRFVLARVRAKKGPVASDVMPNIECLDIAMERFSQEWIPLDSEHERRVCDLLVAEGREFAKPFTQANRKDWISGLCLKLGVVPDFVLTDRKPAVFMEVLGRMNEPDYQVRTAEKMAIYQKTGRPVWTWDVLQTDMIPELP
ncbi:DUF1173 family protein [Acidithiobacillus ferrooxidans]|uniref:DUF1173 family protein n=1 Tax=Acidithiobacillus ferrooxidans TaxID=920 RepID=UPI000AC7A9C1|nr:DUF1173 family protein [Acidithiobacillus ferrooxidans]